MHNIINQNLIVTKSAEVKCRFNFNAINTQEDMLNNSCGLTKTSMKIFEEFDFGFSHMCNNEKFSLITNTKNKVKIARCNDPMVKACNLVFLH